MALPIMTQLVTVEIDLAPGGTPEGTPVELHCVLSMSNYTQTRATTDYSCMSSDETFTALGSITRDPLTFELLYSEENTDGQIKLQEAFANNTEIIAEIEFNNPLTPTTGTGTKLHGLFGVSKYDMSLEKDSAIGATFELVFIGVPVLSIAT